MNIPRGDFGYALQFSATDADGGVLDLTGYTVTLKVFRPGQRGMIVNATCSVTDATGGVCTYTIGTADFPKVGEFTAELELTKSGVKETLDSFTLNVVESM